MKEAIYQLISLDVIRGMQYHGDHTYPDALLKIDEIFLLQYVGIIIIFVLTRIW